MHAYLVRRYHSAIAVGIELWPPEIKCGRFSQLYMLDIGSGAEAFLNDHSIILYLAHFCWCYYFVIIIIKPVSSLLRLSLDLYIDPFSIQL